MSDKPAHTGASDELPGFIRHQLRFAHHIRQPDTNPAPDDIEDRRMAIYRELFYNNIEDFLASSFPVLRELTPDDRWHAMLRDYFAHHHAHTPLFPEMPREFLRYLETERHGHADDPAFLQELAHYEWVEWAVMIDTREPDTDAIDSDGDLLEGVPVLSPLARPLMYRFPVHEISHDFQPAEAPEQPTWLVVYRNADDEVGFMQINAVTARLLDILTNTKDKTGRRIMQQIAEELGHPNPDVVIQGGLTTLQELRQRDIILGTQSPQPL